MPEPLLRVGLIQGREVVEFDLNGTFLLGPGEPLHGRWQARRTAGGVALVPEGTAEPIATGASLHLRPLEGATFLLRGMTVGVGFHWQHEEDLAFSGELSFEAREVGLDAVNAVPLEDYLCSVISSEMSATCPPALLEAHAVISRSWLLAQLEARGQARAAPPGARVEGDTTRIIRWYDREDHAFFDVCADDHCQRYQGVTRAFTPEANAAVAATRGLVLRSGGCTCDARFSKSCGGMTELFSSAWGDEDPPYLQAFSDLPAGEASGFALPLTEEAHATAFIEGAPAAFCGGADRALLERLLPKLDHDTRDFYRWEVVIAQEELRELLRRKLDLDLGCVRALVPVQRGPSGRLTRLRIEGSAGSAEIGKELEIRRALSATHLYSSAFVVHPEGGEGGVPARFRLRGAGWGHGVGLCQIGAAVMAERGYDFRAILAHYYRGAELGAGY
jgi:peptidoglycan hydrolase-like amidase